jgi:uncharacterized protein YjbI with pentapeptide repeats
VKWLPQMKESCAVDREEAIRLLKSGQAGVKQWNAWREANPGATLPDLSGADLSEANLRRVDFSKIPLNGADFRGANLEGANLCQSCCIGTQFQGANLNSVNFKERILQWATFTNCTLRETDFGWARLAGAHFAGNDLSETRGLGEVMHFSPSVISIDTISKTLGRIPAAFLRGCGLSPWEVATARLYDPKLKAHEIADIQREIFQLRTKGPLFIGRVFISYSHADSRFVDKLEEALCNEGTTVWRDVHDLVAGPLERQVFDAIRFNDVVLLVLSESSVKSDWVEAELEKALQREKKEGRDILLPVALDDAWKAKVQQVGSTVLWRQIMKKNILDFSRWKTKAFDEPFGKLVTGAKRYYAPATPTPGGVLA